MEPEAHISTPPAGPAGTVPKAELLRALGRLARGLSVLFWGLPITFIICVETVARTDFVRSFKALPAVAATGWLAIGVWQLGAFQKQERIWMSALDRAKLLALINFGLSPFLFFLSQVPDEPLFLGMVAILAVSGLCFLSSVNHVLFRLSTMLPDENLRVETRHFSSLNRMLAWFVFLTALAIFYLPIRLPGSLEFGPWLLVFMVLLPLALTMALIWKVKEVILEGVFSGQ